ncbi:MAG: TonB family protein [candidate division Zixibacteria bacterium]|nr:TonB family protein [candidate division Zixibacteria bacterium]
MKHKQRTPYGAYELKATYQRNMLVAMMIVTSAVLVVLLAAAVAAQLSAVDVEPIDTQEEYIEIIINTTPPPTIIREKKDFTVEAPRRKENVEVGIPTPVPDTEGPDEDMLIASQADLRNKVGTNPFDGGGGAGPETDLRGRSLPPMSDWEPRMGDFVKVEVEPEMIYEETPTYPKLLQKAGITGIVWVWALVDEQGKVTKAQVARSSGNDAMDEAAVKAAYKCQYSPGIQNGRPVKVGVTYKVEFVL